MKKILLLILFGNLIAFAHAQVGNTSLTFQDPSRNNRSIPCDVFYPATNSGANSPVLPGVYPVVVVGHGFVIGISSYELIADYLVPQGFVVALVNTEGGFAPSHGDFGLDLAFAAHALQAEGTNATSILYGAIDPVKEAIVGHSMGGGASWLAASNDNSIDAIVGLAPAETNPSAIAAAANVQCPVLIFSGSDDTVTPAADNHTPIFDGSNTSCKFFVNLEGGSHCGYIPAGSLCDFGEPLGGSLSRANQQAAYLALLDIWLRQVLKSECTEAEWQATLLQYPFALANSNLLTCLPCIGIDEEENTSFQIYPNPTNGHVFLNGISKRANLLRIYAMDGTLITEERVSGQKQISISYNLNNGIYLVELIGEFGKISEKKMVVIK